MSMVVVEELDIITYLTIVHWMQEPCHIGMGYLFTKYYCKSIKWLLMIDSISTVHEQYFVCIISTDVFKMGQCPWLVCMNFIYISNYDEYELINVCKVNSLCRILLLQKTYYISIHEIMHVLRSQVSITQNFNFECFTSDFFKCVAEGNIFC